MDLYDFAYEPFNAATHSMWHRICKFNLTTCTNILHGYHRVPIDLPDTGIDPDYLYRASKYVEKSFKLFDEKTSISVEVPSAFEFLVESLKKLDDLCLEKNKNSNRATNNQEHKKE